MVGQLVLFLTRRFLRESARREASRPENGTIRLRIVLRIFFNLGKTPEMTCQGGFVLGRSGSFGLAPNSARGSFGLAPNGAPAKYIIANSIISNAGHFPGMPRPNQKNE